jgi:hypothetical protein
VAKRNQINSVKLAEPKCPSRLASHVSSSSSCYIERNECLVNYWLGVYLDKNNLMSIELIKGGTCS